jgi:hypothetical protein
MQLWALASRRQRRERFEHQARIPTHYLVMSLSLESELIDDQYSVSVDSVHPFLHCNMTLMDEIKTSPSSTVVAPYWLFEHQWERSTMGCTRQTTLSVVFNEKSRHLFSAVRIVFYCRSELFEKKGRGWVRMLLIQGLEQPSSGG